MPIATTHEIAEALGLSDRTIRNYAAEGRIPFSTTPGGHRRFDLDAVRRALGVSSTSVIPTLQLVRDQRSAIRAAGRRHGAGDFRVFGSVATGTADAESDVDLLVKLDAGRTYADIEDLRLELEALLKCRVDILTDGSCHGRFANVPAQAVKL